MYQYQHSESLDRRLANAAVVLNRMQLMQVPSDFFEHGLEYQAMVGARALFHCHQPGAQMHRLPTPRAVPTLETDITQRNLIYHMAAMEANDLWLKHISQLKRRWHIFNGKKVIAIAYGPKLVKWQQVMHEFIQNGMHAEWITLPNDPVLREVGTFLPLLISVANEPGATFYAHSKGNSTDGSVEGSIYWRNAMYHHLLDGWEECMEHLKTHACVGTHKMIWPFETPPYPTGLRNGRWCFAGTYWWFRNDITFSQHWRYVPPDRYGTEAWLAGMYGPKQGYSIFQPWNEDVYPTPNPYDPSLYTNPIKDD